MEIKIEAIWKEMREMIGDQAQQIAILKATINTPATPTEDKPQP